MNKTNYFSSVQKAAFKENYMGEELPQNYLSLEENVLAVRKLKQPPVMPWLEFKR